MSRLFTIIALLFAAPVAGAAEPSFRADVAPILANRCVSCHGGQKAKGGYKLQSFADLLTAGKSGETPVAAGKPNESELLTRLTETDLNRRMPPADEPLSVSEVEAVRALDRRRGEV